ncbi:DUF4158 domain-containing protein [Streptomyces hygroscopicus]|uniref:DUF4158 domain-containing protein n=1 Tax=Streptomyces hygroscopicus TaxID=1912 RepID=UPI00223F8432|nr:DUF4158 domain-containing protein [Streptomyces hygroscopicus]
MACWTPVDGDWPLVANKNGPTRLGFALTLKFFEQEGRFPEFVEEIPQTAMEYVADLVRVPAAEFAKYAFTGRTAEYHRNQIREALGLRLSTRADEQLRPPIFCRLDRAYLGGQPGDYPARAVPRRPDRAAGTDRPHRDRGPDPGGEGVLRADRRPPGRRRRGPAAGASSRGQRGRRRAADLTQARPRVGRPGLAADGDHQAERRAQIGLPDGLFVGCSGKLVAAWRARAFKMYPSDLHGRGRTGGAALRACFSSL